IHRENAPLDNPAPPRARAMIGALRGNSALARDLIKAASRQPQKTAYHAKALQLFAALADREELLPEAEVFYRECIKYPPAPAAEPLIYGSLLRVLWKGRRLEETVDLCRAALKQTQSSTRVLLRADLARALGYLQRWDEALAEIDQAMRDAKDTEAFTVRHLRVRLLTQAGRFD